MTTIDERDDASTPEQRFGRLVRDRRKALGASQETIAQRLRDQGIPITQAKLSRLEQAGRPTTLGEAAAICRALDIPAEEMSAVMSGAGADATTERAQWLAVLLSSRAIAEQSVRVIEARAALRGQVGALGDTVAAAGKAMRRWVPAPGAPPRDLEGLAETLTIAEQLIREENQADDARKAKK